MYKDKTLCVVIPAFNESTQIGGVIESDAGLCGPDHHRG